MSKARYAWFEACAERELRMSDGQVMLMQQNGAAFFGSACLLGIGAGFTVFSAADSLGSLEALGSSQGLALKALFLMLAYALAFFEFTWAYRLFGYNAIALGAMGTPGSPHIRERAHQAAGLNILAGQHFTRAMRLFLHAIPLVFWLVSVWAMVAATLVLTLIMLRRQFFTRPQLGGLSLAWNIQEKS